MMCTEKLLYNLWSHSAGSYSHLHHTLPSRPMAISQELTETLVLSLCRSMAWHRGNYSGGWCLCEVFHNPYCIADWIRQIQQEKRWDADACQPSGDAKRQDLFNFYRSEKTSMHLEGFDKCHKEHHSTDTKINVPLIWMRCFGHLYFTFIVYMQIKMGGMMYCPKENRGINRSSLPAPHDVGFTKDAVIWEEEFFPNCRKMMCYILYLAGRLLTFGVAIWSFNPVMGWPSINISGHQAISQARPESISLSTQIFTLTPTVVIEFFPTSRQQER